MALTFTGTGTEGTGEARADKITFTVSAEVRAAVCGPDPEPEPGGDSASPDMEAWFDGNDDDNWLNTSLLQKCCWGWENSGAIQVIRGISSAHWAIDFDPDDARTIRLWEFAHAPEHVRKLTRVQNGKFIAEIANKILEEEKGKHPWWEMGGDFAPHAVSFTPHPHRPGFTIVMGV